MKVDQLIFKTMMDALINQLKTQASKLNEKDKVELDKILAELESYKSMEPEIVQKLIASKLTEITSKLNKKDEKDIDLD